MSCRRDRFTTRSVRARRTSPPPRRPSRHPSALSRTSVSEPPRRPGKPPAKNLQAMRCNRCSSFAELHITEKAVVVHLRHLRHPRPARGRRRAPGARRHPLPRPLNHRLGAYAAARPRDSDHQAGRELAGPGDTAPQEVGRPGRPRAGTGSRQRAGRVTPVQRRCSKPKARRGHSWYFGPVHVPNVSCREAVRRACDADVQQGATIVLASRGEPGYPCRPCGPTA